MRKRQKKQRKKGAIMIEFLVVLPVFMFTVWGIMQLMLLTLAISTMNQSTMEGARILAQNLRGYEGQFSDGNLSKAGITQQQIAGIVSMKMQNVTKFNDYILLFKDKSGNSVTPPIEVGLTKDACMASINGQTRAICIWSDDTFGDGQEQVGVVATAKFHVIGNFIPGLSEAINIKGIGLSHKDLTNRFNYYD